MRYNKLRASEKRLRQILNTPKSGRPAAMSPIMGRAVEGITAHWAGLERKLAVSSAFPFRRGK